MIGRSLTLAMGLIASASLAATPADDLLGKAWQAQRDGRYLDALSLERQAAFDKDCRIRNAAALDMYGQASTFVDPEPTPDPGAKPDWQVSDADIAAIGRASGRDALDEIAARAARTRVTILNEDHAQPRSRAFAYEVAKRLRPLGYDILATEAFDNLPDVPAADALMQKLAKDGYARQSIGVYTSDPVYASFVRGALVMGYRPANYEATSLSASQDPAVQIAARDQGEADNIVRYVLARHPDSKILIYVGFSHVTETPIVRHGRQTTWMAARLKTMTGIDPLTIDQTTFMSTPSTVPSRPIYPLAAIKAKGRSIVLMDGDRPLVVGPYAGAVDLQVVHPVVPPIAGRPGWLAVFGGTPVPVPARLRPAGGSELVQAFGAGDAADAVPLDQVMWDGTQPPPSLLLPSGPVRYAVQAEPARVCPGKR